MLRDILNISMSAPGLPQGHHLYSEGISFYAFQGIYSLQRRNVDSSQARELDSKKGGSEWAPGSNAWMISFPGEGRWGIFRRGIGCQSPSECMAHPQIHF